MATEHKAIPARHVAAVVIGNGLEFYDFLCYATFAVYIGKAYFPPGDARLNLLFSLATFGLGFITRPIGAIVLGGMGDRVGRKPAMLLSFALMGLGMAALAFTPDFAQIGWAAPLIIVLARLVQGFALGGEVGPSTAFLMEAAPPHRRGFYTVLQPVGQRLATLVAGLAGLAVTAAFGPEDLQSWAWRLPFVFGLIIIPFGLFLRQSLPETLHDGAEERPAPRPALQAHARLLLCGFFLLASVTIAAFVLVYFTTYALTVLHLPPSVSFGATALVSAVSIVVGLAAGHLTDRIGRKPLLVLPNLVMALLAPLGFWVIVAFPSTGVFYAVLTGFGTVSAIAAAPVLIAITEGLPRQIRSGGLATLYAFAIAIFGGTTQVALAWLLQVTGNPLMPGWYWAVAALAGALAAVFLPETAPRCAATRTAPA